MHEEEEKEHEEEKGGGSDLRDDPEPLLADELGGAQRPRVQEGQHVLGHVVQALQDL